MPRMLVIICYGRRISKLVYRLRTDSRPVLEISYYFVAKEKNPKINISVLRRNIRPVECVRCFLLSVMKENAVKINIYRFKRNSRIQLVKQILVIIA